MSTNYLGDEVPDTLLPIVSGSVVAVFNDSTLLVCFVSGSLIGEAEFLAQTPSLFTYRTRRPVQALKILANLCSQTLSQTKNLETRMQLHLRIGRFSIREDFLTMCFHAPGLMILLRVFKVREDGIRVNCIV